MNELTIKQLEDYLETLVWNLEDITSSEQISMLDLERLPWFEEQIELVERELISKKLNKYNRIERGVDNERNI